VTVDPVTYFPGKWTFERKIRDRLAMVDGKAHGTATFTIEGGGLRWLESARLEIGEADTRASRELWIRPDPSVSSGWRVHFDDGRPFHPLELGDGEPEVTHPCRDDLYEGSIAIDGENLFRTSWTVRGPRKDQSIETTYRRISESGSPGLYLTDSRKEI